MLCKELQSGTKKQSSMGKSMNFEKKLTVVRNTNGKSTSFTKDYQLESPSCGLNYWGAGPMDKDFMF